MTYKKGFLHERQKELAEKKKLVGDSQRRKQENNSKQFKLISSER